MLCLKLLPLRGGELRNFVGTKSGSPEVVVESFHVRPGRAAGRYEVLDCGYVCHHPLRAGIMLAAPLVLLYGSQCRRAAAILRILVIEVILAGAHASDVAGIHGALAARSNVLQAIGLLLTVPIMLFLVPRFGIKGAAFCRSPPVPGLLSYLGAFPVFSICLTLGQCRAAPTCHFYLTKLSVG
jgi:hypothetical protein